MLICSPVQEDSTCRGANTLAQSLQSCPTLCHPMHCSLPGCSVHGILQARILEWVSKYSCVHMSKKFFKEIHTVLWECKSCGRPSWPPDKLILRCPHGKVAKFGAPEECMYFFLEDIGEMQGGQGSAHK